MVNVVTLDEVRRHLRFPPADTVDDASLQVHIDAADEVMRKETGANIPTEHDEYYDGGNTAIYLINKPILSVELVEEGWGFANFTLDYVQVNSPPSSMSMYSYSIDDMETGIISRRTAGSINIPFMRGVSNIRINYTSGRNPIPAVIRLAELELIAHWWQNSQQRAAAASGQYTYDSVNQDFPRSGLGAGLISINQGVPWRILEMIKPYRSEPIIG